MAAGSEGLRVTGGNPPSNVRRCVQVTLALRLISFLKRRIDLRTWLLALNKEQRDGYCV